MTTPDDTATPETTRATDQRTTADTSPQIPGRTPITEEAGAPLVPRTRPGATDGSATDETDAIAGTDATAEPLDTPDRPSPPTDAEREAPLVPDLRPTRRARTDGGSR
ncbi:hypothetical protein EXE53_07030 [Halorubrum sp. SD626R]|jgi:hypothetical protein|nr:hypothetical protein [Halorubrum sp. SD626R]TKX81203.1 hypothetical protein EXE53_07030 [Halorubrum sp. SD626R]